MPEIPIAGRPDVFATEFHDTPEAGPHAKIGTFWYAVEGNRDGIKDIKHRLPRAPRPQPLFNCIRCHAVAGSVGFRTSAGWVCATCAPE